MSWESCMKAKIQDHFGEEAAACASAGSEHDLKSIATCILDIAGDTDPVTLLSELSAWSIVCAI